MKKIIFFVFVVLGYFTPKIASATTIIIDISPNRIILSADRICTYENSNGTFSHFAEMPKIHKCDDIFYSASGLAGHEKKFNPMHIVCECLSQRNSSLPKNINELKNQLKTALEQELIFLQKKTAPKDFYQLKSSVFNLVIAGRNQGELFAYILNFGIVDIDNMTVDILEQSWNSSFGTTHLYTIGNDENIKKFAKNDGLKKNNFSSDISKIKFLMELELNDTNVEYRKNIDIVKLTKSSQEWLTSNKDCPIIMNQ
ncbi:hypothetical protein [uncultured Draconibacterium sp.]|uniref:hypothetical protein n=1 Tax=uncultured Draconibacterium sp. TaxID=1573823 RepID=UPI0029C8504B|nr:hypothetical protein [uncultured Draconibacterium sp.]